MADTLQQRHLVKLIGNCAKETDQGPMVLFKANLKVVKGISLEEVQNKLENSTIKTDLIAGFQTDMTGLTRNIREDDGSVGVLGPNGTVRPIVNDFSLGNSVKKLEEMASEEISRHEEVIRLQQAAEVQLQIEAEQIEAQKLKEQEERIAIQAENLHRLEEFAKAQNEDLQRSEESVVLFEGNFITTSLESSNFISNLDLIQEEVKNQMKIEETDDIKVRGSRIRVDSGTAPYHLVLRVLG